MLTKKNVNIYHNPNFLNYNGNHNNIRFPSNPIGTIKNLLSTNNIVDTLNAAYFNTQHIERPWWNNPGAQLNVRSTSIGDILELDGFLYVVEHAGFSAYAPTTEDTITLLTKAHEQMGNAINLQDLTNPSVRHLISAYAEYEAGLAALHFNKEVKSNVALHQSQPGDLTNNGYRVIARQLKKQPATAIARNIPRALICNDNTHENKNLWAVIVQEIEYADPTLPKEVK